jgi:hypothetical protein
MSSQAELLSVSKKKEKLLMEIELLKKQISSISNRLNDIESDSESDFSDDEEEKPKKKTAKKSDEEEKPKKKTASKKSDDEEKPKKKTASKKSDEEEKPKKKTASKKSDDEEEFEKSEKEIISVDELIENCEGGIEEQSNNGLKKWAKYYGVIGYTKMSKEELIDSLKYPTISFNSKNVRELMKEFPKDSQFILSGNKREICIGVDGKTEMVFAEKCNSKQKRFNPMFNQRIFKGDDDFIKIERKKIMKMLKSETKTFMMRFKPDKIEYFNGSK